MLFLSLVLNIIALNCLVLKTVVDKNLELNAKDSKPSCFTKLDILSLKNLIHKGHNKHHSVLHLPRLKLPSIFTKEEVNTHKTVKSTKLRIPTKLTSSAKSDLKCCGIEVKEIKPKPKGHYERVERKIANYFWVSGKKPSGMPGSFVVSENEAKMHLGLERR